MASLSRDGNKNWRILFMAGDGTRKVVRLSGANKAQAEKFRDRVESLVTASIIGAMDDVTAGWIAALPDDMHKRLATVGLVKPRQPAVRTVFTMRTLYDEFFAALKAKPGTRLAHKQAADSLLSHFGESMPVADITPMLAEKWKQSQYGAKLANATIAKRTQTAKQIFRQAVKWKMLADSPFADVTVGSQKNKARQFFITRDVADKVLKACPDGQWRLLFALSRYGGLRCPSEHLALKWGDIDFERGTIRVPSSKTEHHEGGDERVIPMFPELRGLLLEAFTEAEPGSEHVITRYREANCNLRTQLLRIIGKAGVKPWPKLFHNLRSSRQTELAQSYPLHVVCEWIGNSRAVAQDHYLQITDAHFAQAAQIPAQQPSENVGTDKQLDKVASAENKKRPGISEPCLSVPILADSSSGSTRIRTEDQGFMRPLL